MKEWERGKDSDIALTGEPALSATQGYTAPTSLSYLPFIERNTEKKCAFLQHNSKPSAAIFV